MNKVLTSKKYKIEKKKVWSISKHLIAEKKLKKKPFCHRKNSKRLGMSRTPRKTLMTKVAEEPQDDARVK